MKVLVLMHEDLVPESGANPKECQTERDVIEGLKVGGHEVSTLGVGRSLGAVRQALFNFKPHVVFNLLEEFAGNARFESHVVSYLEMKNVAYTGCNARGLQLAKDKAIANAILQHHKILTPQFEVFPRGRKFLKLPPHLKFPLIVKALSEEASKGLTTQSVVTNTAALKKQIERMHEQVGADALVEEYIDGRELYFSLIGNNRLKTLPVWELQFGSLPKRWPRVATEKLKWNKEFQKKYIIDSGEAIDLSHRQIEAMKQISKKAYEILGLSGYARMDLRMNPDGQIYFLEANPNPNISADEDFAQAASTGGYDYPQLLDTIVRLGVRWTKDSNY